MHDSIVKSVATSNLLAIDLGAESGRAILGAFDGERVHLREVHRFPNGPVIHPDGMFWDALRIYDDICTGIGKAGAATGNAIDSLAVNSWAVDFGLLDSTGALIGSPSHYRDPRTEGMLARAYERVPATDIYRATGIQSMPINTLSQLLSMEGSPALDNAHTMLLIPDLLRYWMSGDKSAEYTISTTTQLYDPQASDWAWDIIRRLGINEHLFPGITPEATTGSPLRPMIASRVGLRHRPPVVTVASHDTASAVVAIPAREKHFAYISSGTWSLVGVELPEPVVTNAAMEANFTNEGGAFGTIRFLKNVMGLWLLQESRRTWQAGGRELSYDDLVTMGASAPAFQFIVDPDHPAFLAPGDMPGRIRAYCAASGQGVPDDDGEVVRCILESLALKYRWVIEKIGDLTHRPVDVIHVVGGGSRNVVLCQLTADATRREVITGPVEATALGNILMQAVAHGHLASAEEVRQVVLNSFELETYEPSEGAEQWDDAYGRLLGLMENPPEIET